MKRHVHSVLLAALCAVMPLAAEVRLASDGKTDYTVVAPEKPTEHEQAAVDDLAMYLSRITGAEFTVNGDAPKKLYVGKRAPSDRTPLKDYERRVKEENGDIYLYGSGYQGNAFAVYDFLEKFFDCRWYTFFGDECIPEKREAVFDRIDLAVVPSFDNFGYDSREAARTTKNARDFRRRSRIYDLDVEMAEPFLGASGAHILGRVLPPGEDAPVPPGVNRVKPPLKYFKDKAYFKTNPEFFTLTKSGKRIAYFQVCFSNPELRKTLIQNYETIVKNEYKGGPARLMADLNDKGHPGDSCCNCPACLKLNERYQDTGGSYWDFTLELCDYFAKKYPEIKLVTLAYGITSGVPKLPGDGKTPKNLVVEIAPLGGTNFLRDYKDTPRVHKNIADWAKIIGGKYSVWLYPTVYARPLHTYPLVANISRLVRNVRQLHELGMNELTAQFGCAADGDMGFNELRVYLLAALTRDVDADTDALTKDFMDHYYGKASPIMQKYLAELEKCEAAEDNWMRYWPDHRSVLKYLTPKNLLRWQGYFDEMEKLTADDEKANMHVRRCRTNLDEATMSVWYKFKPGEMPDREMMNTRYYKALEDGRSDMYRTYEPASRRASTIRGSVQNRAKAMYYHYALAGKWRPLPPKFAKLQKQGKLFRLVPHDNKRPRPRLADDPEAAAGIAIEGTMPSGKRFNFMLQYWNQPEGGVHPKGGSVMFRRKLLTRQVADDGKYHYHYIGTTRLFPESLIHTAGIRHGSGVMTGLLYDFKRPEQRYDVYISLKRQGKKLWFDEMLFIKSDKPDTWEKSGGAPKNAKTAENERN